MPKRTIFFLCVFVIIRPSRADLGAYAEVFGGRAASRQACGNTVMGIILEA